MPELLLLQEGDLVPSVQEVEWASGLGWVWNILPPTRAAAQDCPTCNELGS